LQAVRPFVFEDNGDRYGWVTDPTGNSHLTLFIEGGRVIDRPGNPIRTGLKEIAKVHTGDFRLTANQNVIIANVTPAQRPVIEALVEKYGLEDGKKRSALRLNALACVALPTCALSLAEAERYLPVLIDDLEKEIESAGLRHDAITIRMTGCPNGCARPYIAEIGFVGRGPERYNVYLGGGHAGQRLSKLYKGDVPQAEIPALLGPVIQRYAKEREEGEKFGDFVIRAGIIAATVQGDDFHKNIVPL